MNMEMRLAPVSMQVGLVQPARALSPVNMLNNHR